MPKLATCLGVLAALLCSSSAWAVPQNTSCRHGGRWQSHAVAGGPMCLLLQDPWQDCDEDPWQLSSRYGAPDTFSDPWQDAEDPWQPFVAETAKITGKEVSADPWQPVISQLVKTSSAAAASDSIDDPWQPAFADPWQDGADDPWQLP